MSENGVIYTAGKNFTLPPALTAWTNSTSAMMMTMMMTMMIMTTMMTMTTPTIQAPTLYDDRDPIDYRLSEIGLATSRPMAGAYQERPDQVQY